MAIVIGFLTLIMVLISLFLILLVLVQLPKKEAGVGMAFGAGMSEMILGAGSGNVLTRITKYTVGAYLVLALALSVLIAAKARREGLGVMRALEDKARSAPMNVIPQPAPNQGLQSLSGSNLTVTTSPLVSTTTVVTPVPAAPAPATKAPGAN